MTNEELIKELEILKKNTKGLSKEEVEVQVKGLIEGAGLAYHEATEKKFNEMTAANEALKAELEAERANIIKLDGKLAEAATREIEEKGFMGKWADMIEKNKEVILGSGGTSEVKMNLKADMTLGTALTGSAVRTYHQTPALNPAQALNFRQLVASIQSATGIYVVYREQAVVGGPIADQVEGASKANIEFRYQEVTFNAAYLAGYVRFTRQMATDLPFLSTSLPPSLLREYYKAENSKFYTALSTAATASTQTITGNNKIEMLMNDIATLEQANWMPNGVVVTPADWYAIAQETRPGGGTDYSHPFLVQMVNNNLTINGIPVLRAVWVAANKYLIGDWTQASRMNVAGEGLNVRFFEQDANNVTENKVTARIEERNVLVIERPDAFIFGDFTAT